MPSLLDEAAKARKNKKQRAYYRLHKKEKRVYRKAHSEEHKVYQRKYRKAHKKEIKAANKIYRDAHKVELKAKRDARKEERKAYRKSRKKEDRAYYIRHTYRLEPEQITRCRKEQNNRCKICGKRKKLEIDHDHKTKRFRGLLCGKCNRALGLLRDDPDVLAKARKYLLSSKRKAE